MPGGIADTLANQLNDHVLGGGDYTRPATVYITLFTVMPTGSGGGTEATGGGYARLSVTNNATNWPASASRIKTNGAAFEWSAFSAALGDLVGAAVFDASSGGNLLFFGPFPAARTVSNGQGFVIPAGAAQFTSANG